MNFDKYFATYLYEHQFISLPSIGEFTLDKAINFANEEEKKNFFPSDGLRFSYNNKAIIQPEFVQYIRSYITKPNSLIESDIEDYTLQIINWLNIGKPYTIEGIGTLTKLQNGKIEFSVGVSKVENISSIISSIANKESNFEEFIIDNSNRINAVKTKKTLLAFIYFFFFLFVFWIINYFIGSSKQKSAQTELPENILNDTVKKVVAKVIDTNTVAVFKVSDTIRYKMYFLSSKYKEKADKQFAYWSKFEKVNRDEVIVKDTMRYRLYIYKKAIPKDTTDVKISLSKYFNHAITIEKEN